MFCTTCLEGTTEQSDSNRARSVRWDDANSMFLKGTTSQDMYGSTPVAMYKEPVLRRSAFQAHLSVLVNPDTSCPVTVAALRSAFQALSTNDALRKAWKSDNVCLQLGK